MSDNTCDVIVIGCGGVGSAALYHLARRGARVLGIDRFAPPHDRGSSHGHTRIIRQAYFEHSDYVPLLRRAYQLWAELQAEAECRLMHQVGLLEIGPPDGEVVPGVLEAAERHGLEIEKLDGHAIAHRFPMFAAPDDLTGVFEKQAGYLLVEDCVRAHLGLARRHGASLEIGQRVIGWQAERESVVVRTEDGEFRAAGLIIAAGPWASELLHDLGLSLSVVKKHLHWYGTDDQRFRQENGCPTFLFELPSGVFYGFPQIDPRGIKVGQHDGGVEIDDPMTADRRIDDVDRSRVEAFLSVHLPAVVRRATDHSVCFYTMSPDGHFVVDRHPQHPHVSFVAGLSGHGFKFTGVLGEALADWALGGETTLPVGFLGCDRPAVRGLTGR